MTQNVPSRSSMSPLSCFAPAIGHSRIAPFVVIRPTDLLVVNQSAPSLPLTMSNGTVPGLSGNSRTFPFLDTRPML